MRKVIVGVLLMHLCVIAFPQTLERSQANALKLDALGLGGFALGFIHKMDGRVGVEYQHSLKPKGNFSLLVAGELRVFDDEYSRYWWVGSQDSIWFEGDARQYSLAFFAGLRYRLPIFSTNGRSIHLFVDPQLGATMQSATLYPKHIGLGFLRQQGYSWIPRVRAGVVYKSKKRIGIETSAEIAPRKHLGDGRVNWPILPGLYIVFWF